MTTAAEAAKVIRENLARAKGALRREELARALTVTAEALEGCARISATGTTRFALEVTLDEQLGDICRHAAILPMLPAGPDGKPFTLRYVRGKESILSAALRRMAGILEVTRAREEEEARRKADLRRRELLDKGQALLDAGEIPKARVFFRRVADEFGATQGVLPDIAARYSRAGWPVEALEMYEQCMDAFPRDPAGWSGAIDMYMEMQEFEKAEKMYVRVLQQFGRHPRTLCNIAGFYLQWRRKGKAAEFALRALQLDPDLIEAREILRMAEGRG